MQGSSDGWFAKGWASTACPWLLHLLLLLLPLAPIRGACADARIPATEPSALSVVPVVDCHLLDGGGLIGVSVNGVRQGTLTLPEGALDLLTYRQIVYAGLRRRGVAVIDLSDPTQPRRLTDLRTDDEIVQIVAQGEVLELRSSESRSRWFFSLANPKRPSFLRRIDAPADRESAPARLGTLVNVHLRDGNQLAGSPIAVKPGERLTLLLPNGARYTVAWSELVAPLVLPGITQDFGASAPVLAVSQGAQPGPVAAVPDARSPSSGPAGAGPGQDVLVYLHSNEPVRLDLVREERRYPMIEQPTSTALLLLRPQQKYLFHADGFTETKFKLTEHHQYNTLSINLIRTSWMKAGIGLTVVGGIGAVSSIGLGAMTLINAGLYAAVPSSWGRSSDTPYSAPSYLVIPMVTGAVLIPIGVLGIAILAKKATSKVQIQ